MSEYQYYEFRAIDRQLTEQEMAELRGCRAARRSPRRALPTPITSATSAAPKATASTRELEQWLRDLPLAEKDELLLRLVRGAAPSRAELLGQFRAASPKPPAVVQEGKPRTVRELLDAAGIKNYED
ncbi:MAG: hypothetical protein ACYDCQ_03225 [Dehalococcoidia bacterium]